MITNTDNKAVRQGGRTPRWLFNQLHREYGFDWDCFASISNHLLPNYWTTAHNAFSKRLRGAKGFANPPFGIIRRALQWGYDQRHDSFTCFLVPANIETQWFLDLAVEGDKHAFDKRIAYEAPPGIEYTQPSFASCLVMFGPNVEKSDLAFSALRSGDDGTIIRRHTGIQFKDQYPSTPVRIHLPRCITCNKPVSETTYQCAPCQLFDAELPF